MWRLWILPLAASFLLPETGEVVNSFSSCNQFFLGGNPPNLRPMNPARICQFYWGKYRFATMYNISGRIPLFSAYKYQPDGMGRRNDWKIEPQLALPGERTRRSMELEKTCKIDPKLLEKSQAVSKDYKQSTMYDKGHLLPVSHQPDQDSKAATFTLTNIMPQFYQLNRGKWAEYERNMKKYTTGCRETYVLVGVVAGDKLLNKRVTIPSHIWAAACCVSQDNQRRSWAVVARNSENEVYPGTLRQLETFLGKCYGKKNINLFNGACYSRDIPGANTIRRQT
ncbi:endonuclease domain-containing 1 protein-like [Crotalus tigris]|uniref:endonuclease domain-containing 1 protein-like n=1 Tax=Crotalus tigris TaxID=88082 RepID=UPI00192FAE2D|nr:endonuclease domain-containing 1 protein-like [Crotalus tigris]